MIHPSIEEPFSHSVLEGMRAGLPIVATRVGGTPEALVDGETSLLVQAKDSQALAEAVITLAGSREMRERMGQANQKRWREEFRLERMMRKFENCFNSLVNGSADH